jgi:hypothetical protein
VLAAWSVAWASLAASAPEPVIRIEGTLRCLTPAGVEARVTSWSERPEIPADARIELVHEVERLRVRVSLGGSAPIERTFSPPPVECKDAELVAAVAIALGLDALAEASAVEDVSTGEGDEEGPASPAPPASPVSPPTPTLDRPAQDEERPLAPDPPPLASSEPIAAPASSPDDRRPSTALVLAAGGAARELPLAGFTGAVGMRLGWRALAITTELELGARAGAPLRPGDGVADLVRVAASVGACGSFGRGRWRADLCALGLGGPLWARARRTAMPRASVVPWAAVAARSELAVELSSRWWLGLRSDVLFGVVRPSLVATEIQTGRRTRLPTPTVGWRAMLAVGIQLGSTRVWGRSRRDVHARVKRRATAPMQGGT